MKKLVLTILFLFYVTNISYSTIVTGGVEYNQESAAEEVFREHPQEISFNFIKTHLTDSCNFENISALQAGLRQIKDRKLGLFSDGTYGVMYFDDPEYSWYYTHNGKLVNFTHKSSLSYPCKITKYHPDGSVVNTGLKVSENESFIFSPQGELLAHWKGNLCFDKNDNIIMTRKLVE